MIIHSTTLDTEAKVMAIYGGVSWSKIEGRFLLGQSSDYTVNSIGGSSTNTLDVANLPSHSHGLNNHTHSIPALSGSAKGGNHNHNENGSDGGNNNQAIYAGSGGSATGLATSFTWGYERGQRNTTDNSGDLTLTVTTTKNTTGKSSGNTTSTGSGTAVNNMPPYKTVYIWERTA